MIYLHGIDYSINTPCMVTYLDTFDGPFDISKIFILMICEHKKKSNFKGLKVDSKFVPLQRYAKHEDILKYHDHSKIFIDEMKRFKCDRAYRFVALEGYPFRSFGSVTRMTENAAFLKCRLWDNYFKFCLFPPLLLKFFVVQKRKVPGQKGRVKVTKLDMYEALNKKFNIDFSEYFEGVKPDAAPMNDIVDALWVCYMLWLRQRSKLNCVNDFTDFEKEFLHKRKNIDSFKLPYFLNSDII